MEDLLLSGNIVLEDSRIEDMGCHPYGYFRYVQSYTFVRKYANIMRYYVDVDSYLYKEPVSKAKKPEVLVQAEDKLVPGAEYYMRICGVNKRQSPPPLYRVRSGETPMLVNADLYAALEQLSWQNKPQVNPVRLMSTNNSLATQPGEHYLYRSPNLPDYRKSGFPPHVIVGIWPIPLTLSLDDIGNTSIVIPGQVAREYTADIVYYEGIRCDWVEDKEKKPVYFFTDFVFSLNAVRQMLTIDPELVFAPVYATDRNMQDFRKDAMNLIKTADWSESNKASLYKLRNFCKQWGRTYDSERFDREYPRFW